MSRSTVFQPDRPAVSERTAREVFYAMLLALCGSAAFAAAVFGIIG